MIDYPPSLQPVDITLWKVFESAEDQSNQGEQSSLETNQWSQGVQSERGYVPSVTRQEDEEQCISPRADEISDSNEYSPIPSVVT